MSKVKRCVTCKKELPASGEFFHRNKNRKDGLAQQCKQCAIVASKLWAERNPEKASEIKKRWRENNPEKARAPIKSWCEKHPRWWDQYDYGRAAYFKEYREANREKRRIIDQRRRSIKQQLPATFTYQNWQQALEYFHDCCAYCGNPPNLFERSSMLCQDHFKPVTKGGPYTPDNIIPACQSCNLRKKNKDAEAWLVEKFGTEHAQVVLAQIAAYFQGVR